MKRFTLIILILLLSVKSYSQGHFTVAFDGLGQDHMTIYVVTATNEGIALDAGDEIAVFDGTICCGKAILNQSVVLNQKSTFALIAASYEDLGLSNGFKIGNAISFKFWDSSENKEISGINEEYLDPVTGLSISEPPFAVNVTTFIKLSVPVQVNQDPVAKAGVDQTVNEGASVTLDGSASTDPDGNPLTYKWTAPAGITLSSATAQKPTFTAPEVTINTSYTLTLVVNDGLADSPADQVVVTVKQVNKAPVANAGVDQSVNEGASVTLDGSASTDPDGNPLTYKWTAPAGITLSSATAQKPTFTAPEVTINTNYTFTLIVNDGLVDSPFDQVVITVKQVNKVPVAKAGADQSVFKGTSVSLDGTASSDPENDALTYLWTAPAGISLSSVTDSKPTFKAPQVSVNTSYTLTLVVNDGLSDSPADQVVITVKNVVNGIPVANAGPDQSVNEGTTVTLDGSASTDLDGNLLTYQWTAPTEISLGSATISKPTFTAPNVTADTEFTFSLVVHDGFTDSPADQVKIMVKKINQLPLANAGPDQTVNEGTTVSLNGKGSSDPDSDPLSYKWTAPAGISLSSTSAEKPTFTAPKVGADAEYLFTLVVNDGMADSPADELKISVLNVDHVPYVKSPILDILVNKLIPDEIIDLTSVFADDDFDDVLTFAVKSNQNDQIVLATITGSNLTLSFSSKNKGSSEIVITASSNGKEVVAKFTVEVNIPTEIHSLSDNATIQIYPNPTKGLVNIEFSHKPVSGSRITVYDITGKVVCNSLAVDQVESLNMKGNPQGLYFIKIDQKVPKTYKLVVLQ